MAAAMGQREETVGLGLRWLAARRQVDVRAEDGRGMTLAAVGPAKRTVAGKPPTETETALLAARIRDQLAETAAYRKHWLGMHVP